MKKLVLLSAVVLAVAFASCKTDPATSTSTPAETTENVQNTPAEGTENVQNTPAEGTSEAASENKDAAQVSENKDAAAPEAEQATEKKTEETKENSK